MEIHTDQTGNASTNVSEKTSNGAPLPGQDGVHVNAEESKVKCDHSYAMQPAPYVIFPTHKEVLLKKGALFVPGGRFSNVPKLYGPFSGVTIPFVTQERRAFNSSNFTVIFLFVTLKTC